MKDPPVLPPELSRAADVIFGSRLEQVERYASLLADAGVVRGLIGPREVPRLWERHLLNCGVVAPAVPEGADVCDVGSGAGLPGVVIALLRPDVRMTLVEPLLRRTTFLEETVESLQLPNVAVVRARAEEHEGRYDSVVARAVAPLEKLAALTLPLVRSGGTVLAMKGDRASEELESAVGTLKRLGASDWRIDRYGEGLLEPPTTVVRLERGAAAGR